MQHTFRFWSAVPLFALGCTIGLVALLSMRVVYYDWMGYESSMHPGVAFMALPLLLLFVLAFALPIEAVLQRLVSKPCSKVQAAAVGATSASLLSWWAFPPHWYVIVLVNPLVLRWILLRVGGCRPNKTMEPTR
jgi:hypothetical protein